MLFIYLYHDDLYSDLWKSDLYFRPADFLCIYIFFKSLAFNNNEPQYPWIMLNF